MENQQKFVKQKRETEKQEKKKSRAKAAGVKSVFTIENDVLITSFGKRNDAVLENQVTDGSVVSLKTPASFETTLGNKRYLIDSPRVSVRAVTDMPAEAGSREDLLRAKKPLEEFYYGMNFDDNVHIQLIYSILDIEKILAPHINNIIYTLNNVLREDIDDENEDFIGYISDLNDYETFRNPENSSLDEKKRGNVIKSRDKFLKFIKSPLLGYFGSAFIETGNDVKASKKGQRMKRESDIYYMLACLGSMRQCLAHAGVMGPVRTNYLYSEDGKHKDLLDLLSRTYSGKVRELNRGFIEKSKKDLTILFRILQGGKLERKIRLTQDFYRFTITKEYKNMGFSFKKLREEILTYSENKRLTGKAYDSVRFKLNKLFDFVSFEYYLDHPEKAESFVNALRAGMGEADNQMAYKREAERLWAEIGETISDKLVRKMNGEELKHLPVDPALSLEWIKDIAIPEDASCFSKMMYLVSLFLSGKEINDLLTQLINKFDNIASFNQVMRQSGLACELKPEFALFMQADRISAELRVVNSFARMESPSPSAKKAMFIDAARILGDDASEKELSDYFDAMLAPDENHTKWGGKRDNGLRNFIASNVIESAPFRYLVRYSEPNRVKALASNKAIVRFVLSELPDTQIDRYCESCKCRRVVTREDKLNALADVVADMRFKDIEDVRQGARGGVEADRKMQAQACVSLYLTVLYLAVKNLVYINARYFLAFHCLERDQAVLGVKEDRKYGYASLTHACVGGDVPAEKKDGLPRLNKRANKYVSDNMTCTDVWTLAKYRNTVEHLNAVRCVAEYAADIASVGSYFELYHYAVQKFLAKRFLVDKPDKDMSPKTKEYIEKVCAHKTYCKDFVKALNVPFGYCLARYKNLSIDDLFDRNNLRKTKEKMEID